MFKTHEHEPGAPPGYGATPPTSLVVTNEQPLPMPTPKLNTTSDSLPTSKISLSLVSTSSNSTTPKTTHTVTQPKTTPMRLFTPVIAGLVFILVVIALLIKVVGKEPVTVPRRHREALPPPPFPHEDQAAYNARVNWWLPENERQQGRSAYLHARDHTPDMFEEGRKRLAEEEKQRKKSKK
jgi:hypothetical protein